jgi:hypothetical protein
MRRYASEAEIQRAVNLKATGISMCEVARQVGRPHQTVAGWFHSGGLVQRLGLKPEVEYVEERAEPARVKIKVRAPAVPDGRAIRVLGVGDAHDHPRISKERFYWIGRHAAELGVDYIVQIGDFASVDSLNSHIPNDTLLAKSKNPYAEDMASLREAMGEIERGLGSFKVKKHCTLGNHERRAWRYEDTHPEMAGVVTGQLLEVFEQFGWSTTEYGAYWFLGGAGFTHAPINKLGKTIGTESRLPVLNKMVFDIVRGHDHQEYTQPQAKFGPIGRVTLVGLGCALPHGHVEDYAQHTLHGWSWGVKEILIQGGRIESAKWYSMLELQERYSE